MTKSKTKPDNRESSGLLTKIGLFSAILGGLWFLFQKFSGNPNSQNDAGQTQTEQPQASVSDSTESGMDTADLFDYLPANSSGEVVRHQHYALSYIEKYEVAEWVAWVLTEDRLRMEWVERSNNFRPDPKIESGSAHPEDYRTTHLDRGHLVPAADMAFSNEAMSQTFYMSNISPQEPGFNKGIWRELEELNRDWAKRFKRLYVVTGPVLTQPIKHWIGENQVAVPPSFYRVILDLDDPERKAIGFIVPNQTSTERIESFAVPVDEVETLTGLDFFPFVELRLQEKLESDFDVSLWKTNEKKYQVRVENWNQQ